MPDRAIPIEAAYRVRTRPLSVDDAVRAVLSFRAAEHRSFGNEDDVEGVRRAASDLTQAPPTP